MTLQALPAELPLSTAANQPHQPPPPRLVTAAGLPSRKRHRLRTASTWERKVIKRLLRRSKVPHQTGFSSVQQVVYSLHSNGTYSCCAVRLLPFETLIAVHLTFLSVMTLSIHTQKHLCTLRFLPMRTVVPYSTL